MDVRFLPAGDGGLVVELGSEVSLEINTRVRALAGDLAAARIPGLIEIVPTYRSLGIEYDPVSSSWEEMEARVREVLERLDPRALPPPRRVKIPTVYGGAYGPDLPFLAQHAGLSPEEVIRLHSQTIYHVYMIGFAAGFAYLGGLPERLHTPRLPSPRLRVPKGSVGIGGNQTGAYPAETPGGWRLIGRTPLELFNPTREIPTPMLPGDEVQFVPITEMEYLQAVSRRPGTERRETGDRRPSPVPGPPPPAPGRDVIEVLRPGLLTTVQDRGRVGSQKFGVPTSGAVDEIALRVGNILVGNPQDAAALEITARGPRLRLRADLVLALTGSRASAELDGEPVPWYESFVARTGQTLDVGECTRGLRAYLAVAGGADVPVVLRSRSTCLVAKFGGYRGRALQAGDALPVGLPADTPGRLTGRAAPEAWRPHLASPATIRVVPGLQDNAFTEEGVRTFLESTYQVTPHMDRMGCRLEGPRIIHRGVADILSDWIPMGGIQVPGDGQPIILLADRQTTGGYTKIATVIRPDLGLVAQCRPGDAIRFRAVSVPAAQQIAREMEGALADLPASLVSPWDWTDIAMRGEVPGSIPVSDRIQPGKG